MTVFNGMQWGSYDSDKPLKILSCTDRRWTADDEIIRIESTPTATIWWVA